MASKIPLSLQEITDIKLLTEGKAYIEKGLVTVTFRDLLKMMSVVPTLDGRRVWLEKNRGE